MGLNCEDWDEYQRILNLPDPIQVIRTVFIDNLPFHKTEDDIAAFFAQAGCPVKSLALFLPTDRTEQVQNLGAGYVTFESGEDAERAVDTLNGRVMEEEERKEESGEEERPLFVCRKFEHGERQRERKQTATQYRQNEFLPSHSRHLMSRVSEEVSAMVAMMRSVTSSVSELADRVSRVEASVAAVREQNEHLRGEVNTKMSLLEDQNEELKDQLDTKTQQLHDQNEELKEQNQQLHNQNEKLKEQTQHLDTRSKLLSVHQQDTLALLRSLRSLSAAYGQSEGYLALFRATKGGRPSVLRAPEHCRGHRSRFVFLSG